MYIETFRLVRYVDERDPGFMPYVSQSYLMEKGRLGMQSLGTIVAENAIGFNDDMVIVEFEILDDI